MATRSIANFTGSALAFFAMPVGLVIVMANLSDNPSLDALGVGLLFVGIVGSIAGAVLRRH